MAAMMGMPGCSKPPDPAQLLADARQYRLNGDNKAAVIQLRNLLQQHPNDAEARLLSALEGTVFSPGGAAVHSQGREPLEDGRAQNSFQPRRGGTSLPSRG